MSSTINTNIASLNAQRNLSTSQSALATSLQRLSSGLRINSAKDDAAGLAIASRMTTQISGLNQAVRNANDGISLAQTGDSVLGEITNNLQRIRELAVQSTNSTNSTSDRAAIDLEVQQRLAEIDRLGSTTSFNGQKILDGSFGVANFQVGANAGETISVNLTQSMRTASVGSIATTKSTSSITGAGATGGSVAITNSTLSFGTAPGVASAGNISFTALSNDFRPAAGAIAGASDVKTIPSSAFNLGVAYLAQVDNSNVQSMTTALGSNAQTGVTTTADYSLKGSNAQTGINLTTDYSAGAVSFSVDGKTVTLDQNYTTGAATAALQTQAMVTDLNTTGTGKLGGTGITASMAGNGAITFTRNAASGIADQAAVAVVAGGAATAAGLASTNGTAGTGLNLEVDGKAVNLKGNYSSTSMAGMLIDINNELAFGTDAHITATTSGLGAITFARTDANDTKALVVTADAKAVSAGFAATSAGVGTYNASAFDFSGASGMGQFTVDSGPNQVTVSLDQAYGAGDAGGIAMAADVQSQLRAAGGANLDYAASYDTTSKSLVITKAGATSGVDVATIDSNTLAAGIATQAGSGYVAGHASTSASLTIAGKDFTLTAGTDATTLAAELNTKMHAAGSTLTDKANYNAVVVDSTIQIQHTGSTTAVAITNADSKAAAVGLTNSAGLAGATEVATSKVANLTIDGHAISLEGNYGSFDGLAGAIRGKISSDPVTGYTVSNNAGAITITRNATGASSAKIDITLADTNAATSLGLGGASKTNGTAGAAAGATTNASFKVDGHIVNLATNYFSGDMLANGAGDGIGDQLGTGYTVTYSDSQVHITNNTLGSAAVVVSANNTDASTAAKANAITDGFGAATGTAGTEGGAVTVGADTLTITAGTGAAVSMAGIYTSSQKLADAINADVSGVYASIGTGTDVGKLILSSANSFAVAGGGITGLNGTYAADQGSLANVDVKSVVGANNVINAVDSALSTVSTLRSTFGAIQNRFDSAVASLQAASENASGARSRILDTDFASETANLTRNQILQQAGTAMLAQANTLPQSVLSLLK